MKTLKDIAGEYSDLETFYQTIFLDPNLDLCENIDKASEKDDLVTVSTIHSAKGLEWHTVFICHALEGLIPSLKSDGSLERMEEERRLFYVATSRAKEELFITRPDNAFYNNENFYDESKFITEIKDMWEMDCRVWS